MKLTSTDISSLFSREGVYRDSKAIMLAYYLLLPSDNHPALIPKEVRIDDFGEVHFQCLGEEMPAIHIKYLRDWFKNSQQISGGEFLGADEPQVRISDWRVNPIFCEFLTMLTNKANEQFKNVFSSKI